ncbi:MAG TPA: hypothetical protein VI386_21950 [Candidatus Sulfotelmatobacter sp.]
MHNRSKAAGEAPAPHDHNNVAGWYEADSAFNDPSSIAIRGSMNLGVIAETVAGPIGLARSVSPTGQSRVDFSIGRLF